MKISYHWLQQYINITESPEEIGEVLTSTGLEVERIEPFETVKGGLKGLVIGEVLTCIKHPNADKLSITTVDVGAERPSQIVCGAPNVAAGQKVIVALPGTTIYPTKGESFTIKSAKIRGEQSEGMICAEDEIGLGESHAGIIVLKTDEKNGTLASDFFNIESDFVFEIGLTPNRADAASHIGVARDIKAAKDRDLKWPDISKFKVHSQKLNIDIAVENTEACPRYSGVTLSGVTVGESPDWLKARLKCIGVSPINNLVDITNFVLHEMGQPLHAFDADEIKGRKVIVKTLSGGTKFTTLDNKERALSENDLMICNTEEPMCIAGVFGGMHSGISSKTKNIFLESACFDAAYVRRTGMFHQLKTDASFRFERGTDPNLTLIALKRAALLIKEIAGGEISSEVIDVYPNKLDNRSIDIKFKNVDRLIGKKIPHEEIFSILGRLEIKSSDKTLEGFKASIPTYRIDVVQEADVIEEILRIYGFNNIELSNHVKADFLASFPEKDSTKFKKAIGSMLAANGFYEILTNSLTNVAYKDKIKSESEAVEILNKLSEEQGILRQTMLFSGLEVCAHNLNRKQKDLKLFEFGKIYGKSVENEPGLKNYWEDERLALFITGNNEGENWQNKSRPVNFYDLAQAVEQVVERSGMEKIKKETFSDAPFEYGMKILKGSKTLGLFGKVKNALAKEFGLKQEVFFADLSMDLLFKSANPKFVVQEVPKFPVVRRDLSLVIDNQVKFADIESLARATEQRLIKEIIAFDVYEGEKIQEGKKAYALGFTLQDENKTLTDEDIEKVMVKLMAAFEGKMGAVIRK